jgi:hypothetical protein
MEKILINADRYKKEILIGVTFLVCGIFCFVLYKSYKISKIKQDPDNLPLIKSKIGQIKIKSNLEISVDSNETEGNIINGGENEEINVIIEKDTGEFLSLNDKINELNNEELEKIIVKEEKKAPVISSVTGKSGYKAQLIALQSETQAKNFVENTKNEYGYLIKNLNIFYASVDLGEKGVFYRVQIGFFNTREDAKAFCDAYLGNKKNLLNCIVIK